MTDTQITTSCWSPFDCLAYGEVTESGLLIKNNSLSEMDMLVIHDFLELRGPISPDLSYLVPLTKENKPMEQFHKNQYNEKCTNLTITLTTHRLVFWKTTNSTDTTSSSSSSTTTGTKTKRRMARYIHLSNIFQMEIESSSVYSFFASPKLHLATSIGRLTLAFRKDNNTNNNNNNSGSSSSGSSSSANMTKNRDELYKQLQIALRRQLWEQDVPINQRSNNIFNEQKPLSATTSNNITSSVSSSNNRKVGVDAILSNAKVRHERAAQLTDSAFDGDSETLVQEVTELVKIIHKYVATLEKEQQLSTTTTNNNNANNDNNNSETKELMNLLQNMGMTSTLSKADYRGTEDNYYEELARQLADFLKPKFRGTTTNNNNNNATHNNSGVMTLTDVYCLYNRARGSHFISPHDLLQACSKMSTLQLGLSIYTFPTSGLKVLQDDSLMNDTILSNRFLQMIHDPRNQQYYEQNSSTTTPVSVSASGSDGYITALMVSHYYHISVLLAFEQLQLVEQKELLVRDETLECIRFYPNQFFK